ncbi:MAG: acyl-CoA thioesterase [Gammaproteobacteria bacterium]
MFELINILRRRNAPPTHGLLDTVYRDFRVGLTDIDLNLHLNNARYLKYLDRARVEHMLATGLLWKMIRSRTRSVVANTEISYIRELRTWQPFTVSVRIAGWDEKYFYFEQRFESEGRLCTHAFMRLVHLEKGKGISSAQALARMRIEAESPPLPEPVLRWREMLAAKRDYSKGGPPGASKGETPGAAPAASSGK